MKKSELFIAVLCVVLLGSCDDDDKKIGNYKSDVIIANEGGFGKANASVSHYNQTTGEVSQNIFTKAPLNFAGDVLQSITFSDELAYLVLNGSNKIEIANETTFESVSTISNADLISPRYVTIVNGYAYITVWGPYDENFNLVDSYVLVLDLATNQVLKKIDTDEGCENILLQSGKLFVANYNYGASSTITVINPTDNSVIDEIEVGAGPAGMVIDKNNALWVLCTGGDAAQLVKIDPTDLSVDKTIPLTPFVGTDLAISADGSKLIYNAGKDIYQISIDATLEPELPLFTASELIYLYALDVNPATGDIWLGDAGSFTNNGKVYIYTSGGEVKTNFEVGIAPTQFKFKQ